MEQMPHRLLVIASAALLAACGASEAAGPGSDTAPPRTIGGVGELPATPAPQVTEPSAEETSTTVADEDESVRTAITLSPTEEDDDEVPLIGEVAEGNRLLMVGDSILASTSRRYGREMCDALVPMGWTVELNAERGQFVEFGSRVLDRRLAPEQGVDWDAAVVFLGSNYGEDQAAYEEELVEIVTELAPRPTLLLTVTEYRPSWAEVNEVIEAIDDEYDHVTVADWSTVAGEAGVLSGDRLHPTEAGEEALVELISEHLGDAPRVRFGDEPECLRSQYTDDSRAGSTTGGSTGSSGSSGSGSWSPSGSGSGSSGGSATTAPPVVTSPPSGGDGGGDTGGGDPGGDGGGDTGGGDTGGGDPGGGGSDGGGGGGGTGGDGGGGDPGGGDSGGSDSGDGG